MSPQAAPKTTPPRARRMKLTTISAFASSPQRRVGSKKRAPGAHNPTQKGIHPFTYCHSHSLCCMESKLKLWHRGEDSMQSMYLILSDPVFQSRVMCPCTLYSSSPALSFHQVVEHQPHDDRRPVLSGHEDFGKGSFCLTQTCPCRGALRRDSPAICMVSTLLAPIS